MRRDTGEEFGGVGPGRRRSRTRSSRERVLLPLDVVSSFVGPRGREPTVRPRDPVRRGERSVRAAAVRQIDLLRGRLPEVVERHPEREREQDRYRDDGDRAAEVRAEPRTAEEEHDDEQHDRRQQHGVEYRPPPRVEPDAEQPGEQRGREAVHAEDDEQPRDVDDGNHTRRYGTGPFGSCARGERAPRERVPRFGSPRSAGRALASVSSRASGARGMTERPQGATESVGEARGALAGGVVAGGVVAGRLRLPIGSR